WHSGPVQGNSLQRHVERRLRSPAVYLGDGALPSSGARGVGKSTVLAVLTGDGAAAEGPDAALTVLVSAPVQYDAREFLLHLYAQLCKVVLREIGSAPRRSVFTWLWARTRTILATAVYAAALLLLV